MSQPLFEREELRKLSKEELIDIILALAEQVATLSRRVEELERAAARRAAPFSKGKGKALKKKPGRRAGEGPFSRRAEPEVLPGDRVETIKVPLDTESCPKCGGALDLEHSQTEVATVIDVPAEPTRVIKRFEVEVAVCGKCGGKVRGEHPDLPRDQRGATAHRIGENVLGQAFSLSYGSGLTLRHSADAIGMLTGISVTQSALTQRAGKLCHEGGEGESGTLRRIYHGLREEARQAMALNTDDTGWRTGGKNTFLMGFFTPTLALYQIRDRHRHEEVEEVIGKLFAGILCTDRGSSYEALAEAVMQQKCLSHLLGNLSEVEETKSGRALCFARDLKEILRQGIALWHERRESKCAEEEFRRRAKQLRERLDHHLRPRGLTDADNQRLLDGIGRQYDKGRLTLFLDIPEVEPTNNRGERGLRGAVIARKVSQCSKNATGERNFETVKSIAQTLKLRCLHIARGFASLIRGEPMPDPAEPR